MMWELLHRFSRYIPHRLWAWLLDRNIRRKGISLVFLFEEYEYFVYRKTDSSDGIEKDFIYIRGHAKDASDRRPNAEFKTVTLHFPGKS